MKTSSSEPDNASAARHELTEAVPSGHRLSGGRASREAAAAGAGEDGAYAQAAALQEEDRAAQPAPSSLLGGVCAELDDASLAPDPGVIVLAATPIGQVGDASARLVAAIRHADLIAAEDTRRLRALAARLGVPVRARVVACHEHNERERASMLVEAAQAGQRVLMVSDAGMPSVSDPGFRLVGAAAQAGVRLTVLPGPSAVLTALALSGLPSDRFCFEGFVPRKAGEQRRALERLAGEERTMVFFESPRRVHETLTAMAEVFGGQRGAVLCRELTKTFEEVRRGSLAELAASTAQGVLGEVVLVVAGGSRQVSIDDVARRALALADGGMRLKAAAAEAGEQAGLRANEVYRRALDLRS